MIIVVVQNSAPFILRSTSTYSYLGKRFLFILFSHFLIKFTAVDYSYEYEYSYHAFVWYIRVVFYTIDTLNNALEKSFLAIRKSIVVSCRMPQDGTVLSAVS